MSYDLAVIGAGPGGYVAAIRAGQLGMKTVVIDPNPPGGVCLNWGCIPSKAFITAGKEYHHAVEGIQKGLHFENPRVDMPGLVEYKAGVVSKLNAGIDGLLKANKVERIEATAKFTAKDTLKLSNGKSIKAKQIVVATGSSTIEIPGFKFDEKRILSSTGMLELQEVPEHLVIIGGGVIGLELGGAMNNLGCKQVTVIEMMDQLVPGVDVDIAKALARSLKKKGYKIHLGARAQEAKATKTGVTVQAEINGKSETIKASHCLVSVGRRPNTKDLGLEAAGVKLDERGFIPTDKQGRTNVSTIYAIGDVTHGPMLAHKASKEGIIAAEAASGDKAAAKDWVTIPGVIFTDPEIATAGMTEQEAKDAGHTVKVGKFNVAALGKALADNTPEGFYKMIGDAKTDRVLGIHIFSAHASDLISEAALALEMGATVEDVSLTVHPHPTLGEGIMEVAEALHGKAIHAVNR